MTSRVEAMMTNEDQNPFRASLITLYPEMFPGPLGVSLAGRAHDKRLWQLETVGLRQFGVGKHRQVDDTPAGGGAGMVLRADVLAAAIDHVSDEHDPRPRFLMSPRGPVLHQAQVRELAKGPGLLIVCGRFEGVDERVIEARQLTEISIGDYILSGGEPAAIAMLDAIIRLIPGVMGNALSGQHESHDCGLLEHPHYTRPQIFEGRGIPQVLTSGNHQNIDQWRAQSSQDITRENRPDLIAGLKGEGNKK
jgi:tRNA (guanine37-N1)-methyltransferase